jgi:hypothetical protein
MPLARDREMGRLRAELGLLDPRTLKPSTFSEVAETGDGIPFRITWSQDGIDARAVAREIPRPGTDPPVIDVLVDPRDAAQRAAKQAERDAKKGLFVGWRGSESELLNPPTPKFTPGKEVTFVLRTRGRPRPAWLWPAVMAKITLGCLCEAARLGVVSERAVECVVVHALRMLAFEHLYSPDLWPKDEIWISPGIPTATHPVVGRVVPDAHLFALHPPEHPAQPTLAQLVLFGRKLVELPLPGLKLLGRSYGWYFSTGDLSVGHGELPDLSENLAVERAAASQTALF